MKVIDIKTSVVKKVAWAIMAWCLLWMVYDAYWSNFFGVLVQGLIGAIWTNILYKAKQLEKAVAIREAYRQEHKNFSNAALKEINKIIKHSEKVDKQIEEDEK